MAEEVTVMQTTSTGVEKKFTFRGEIVKSHLTLEDINIDNETKDTVNNQIPTDTLIRVLMKDESKDEEKYEFPRDYQYDAYVKLKNDIDTNNKKYYRYFTYKDNIYFWLRATNIPTVYLFIREDGTFYLIGPEKLLKTNHQELYKKYKYSFDRTENGANFNANPTAYIVIYYDENDKRYKLRLAMDDEEKTITKNLEIKEWKEKYKWQGGTEDVYYLNPNGILSASTLIGKDYKKMSGLCGYINRITMDNETGVNSVSKGGNRRRTRNRKQKRKLRTAKKSM